MKHDATQEHVEKGKEVIVGWEDEAAGVVSEAEDLGSAAAGVIQLALDKYRELGIEAPPMYAYVDDDSCDMVVCSDRNEAENPPAGVTRRIVAMYEPPETQ